jgi:L,D-transpeptidase YcbB
MKNSLPVQIFTLKWNIDYIVYYLFCKPMPVKLFRLTVLVFTGINMLFACNKCHSQAERTENKVVIPENHAVFHQEMAISMSEFLDRIPDNTSDSLKQYTGWLEMIKAVYTSRNDTAIWINKDGLTKKGTALLQLIDSAEYLGLNKALYPLSTLHLYTDSISKLLPAMNYQLAQQTEILLSRSLLEIMLHLDKGIFTDTLQGIRTNFRGTKDSYLQLINRMQHEDLKHTLAELEPQHDLYRRYMESLKRFISAHDISPVNISIRDFKKDSTGAAEDVRKALIYHRLLDDSLSDDAIAYHAALKQFQQQNGLVMDGKLGLNTIKALERTNYSKFQLLVLNADRWRKEAVLHNFPDKFIWVNIPSMRMRIIEKDSLKMEKRVVIGKANKKNHTPVLEAFVQQIVLWPSWTVPQSIIKYEMKSFKGYRVTYSNGMKKVVQPPGPKNALGVVKIDFPNKYAVYMHDTPSKSLFLSDNRAASHGCVRCQDALEVAHYLMSRDTFNFSYDSLVAIKDDTIQTTFFKLKKQVPVYFRYFTAEPDFEGNMEFFSDVYKKDEAWLNVIFSRKKYQTAKSK